MLNWYYHSIVISPAAYHQYFYAQGHSRQLYTLPFFIRQYFKLSVFFLTYKNRHTISSVSLNTSSQRDAIYKHVDNDDKGVANRDTLGGTQKMTIINESGLYSLILSSKHPSAKEFKHWVTSEVLPSIRKNGAYIRNQENMTPAEIVAHGLIAAQKIIEEREKEMEYIL